MPHDRRVPASTQTKQLVVAINPSASFGSKRDVGPAAVQTLRAMGHEVTSLTEPDFESLIASARAAVRKRPDALVVVGGDGMVNLGVNLVAGTKVPLGLIPSGTGNDMARSLGIPHENTEQAIRVLSEALTRPPRVIDAVRVRWEATDTRDAGERWFSAVLSAGFDSIVNERANTMTWPKGKSRYNVAILIELARLTPIHYTLTFDGGYQIERDALLVSAGNAESLGGGMRIVPEAELSDGLLDVCIVSPMSRANFLRIFPSVYKGTHISDPHVEIRRTRTLRIEAAGAVAYADGERFTELPVEAEVRPGALRVLCPPVE